MRQGDQLGTVADVIARFRDRLADAEDLDTVCHLEAQAAAAHWRVWSEVPVLFPHRDAKRVPDHWRGKRQRNRERITVRGLNDNHNHDLKNLFKGAAVSASERPGPLHDFYAALVERAMRPSLVPLLGGTMEERR